MEAQTKYEQARIIGARALQISMGAPFIITLSDEDLKKIGYSTIKIAKMEYEQGLIPISIKKSMPGVAHKEVTMKPFDQTRLE